MDIRTYTLSPSLVLDCREELVPFLIVSTDPSMPTIDVDAVLGAICDAFKREVDADQNLQAVAHHMAYGDGMVESLHDDAYPHEFSDQIYRIIVELGNRILSTLRHYRVYLDGHFPYSYGTILHGHSSIHFTLDTRRPA